MFHTVIPKAETLSLAHHSTYGSSMVYRHDNYMTDSITTKVASRTPFGPMYQVISSTYMDCGVDNDACGREFLCGMCRGRGRERIKTRTDTVTRGDDLRQACEDLAHCKEESNLYFEDKYEGVIHAR